jgi:hypothetical protein
MSLGRARTALLAGLFATTALGAAMAQAPQGAADPVQARTFEVRYRSLQDAGELVGPILSAEGTLTLKPQLRLLVVADRASVLERVRTLLESFDLPPRSVEVTLGLYLGTRRQDSANGHSPPRRSVIELPALSFTHWTSYETLGSRSVNGVEGTEVVADLSHNYRVVFTIEGVDPRHRLVKFRSISLQRIRHMPEGPERIDSLYSAAAVVDMGKQQIFGAATDPEADQALFLTLLTQAR